MTKRRDLFMLVPAPGRADEALIRLSNWLGELDGHPGYLGGAVLRESAGELLPDTMVLMLEFESTAAARALWPKLRGLQTPVTPDGDDRNPPDQGRVLFELPDPPALGASNDDPEPAAPTLDYNRGGGMLARLLHVHAEAVHEFAATGVPAHQH
ncbi:hypothetical protein [Jiangella asiatica]|uniref:Uncharacterized protein n=1 Tax=Jiangella asiatica TaxID=2530372 RepID=A0A4R5DJV8_9ACTN|nr:hypothetical protein E1269_07720 [Jiangella asiatica]